VAIDLLCETGSAEVALSIDRDLKRASRAVNWSGAVGVNRCCTSEAGRAARLFPPDGVANRIPAPQRASSYAVVPGREAISGGQCSATETAVQFLKQAWAIFVMPRCCDGMLYEVSSYLKKN